MEHRKYDEFNYVPPKRNYTITVLQALSDWKLTSLSSGDDSLN